MIRKSHPATDSNLTATQPLDQPALHPLPTTTSIEPPASKPLQSDSTRLSITKQQWQIDKGLSLYCGSEGHLPSCPVRLPCPVVSNIHPSISSLAHSDVILMTSRPIYFSESPHRFQSRRKFHLTEPTLQASPPKETLYLSYPCALHSGKTAEWWLH